MGRNLEVLVMAAVLVGVMIGLVITKPTQLERGLKFATAAERTAQR